MKITFDIDTSDLVAYHEGPGVDMPGAGQDNIWRFFNTNLLCHVLQKKIELLVKEKTMDQVTFKALMNHYDDEEKLARRMVESCKIEP